MKGIRRRWIAAAGALAVTALIATGAVVMAQTPAPGTNGGGATFLERVAQKLGIDAGALRSAVKSTANEDIEAKVQSGQLTQAQADALKQRVENAPDDAFVGPGFGRHGGHGFGPMKGVDDEALAGFLGITTDQLRTELQASGATLASVAQAHGKSRDDLKAFLTGQFKTRLDQEVTEGRLTQAQADSKLSEFTANLDQLIGGTMPFEGHGHGWLPGGAMPPMTPGSGLTPSGGA